MFGDKKIKIKDSERSLISETVSIEGTINSSGAIDVAGLIKGPVYSKELIVRDTGSITGTIEADIVEIHGHLDGKVSAQDIVIGGLAGAAPPLLGWTAITNSVYPNALLLVLIIFAWTPPHFWALVIHRREDYAKENIPMLLVTHGVKFTKLQIILYTIILMLVSLLPFIVLMSGVFYLISALVLGAIFLIYSIRLYRDKNNENAFPTFVYSIYYIFLIFAALLIDHYLI